MPSPTIADLQAEIARLRGLLEAAGIDPDPVKTFAVRDLGGGEIEEAWSGFEPVRLGRIGAPSYNADGGWDTDTNGFGGVTAEMLAAGRLVLSEAKVGVPWTVFAVEADGTRHEQAITPQPAPPPAVAPVDLVDFATTTGGDYQT